MIPGFEEYTHDLTQEELNNIIPLIVRGLETKIGKENAITNAQMRSAFLKKYNIKIHGARMRKMITHIRVTGQVMCLCAGKGYWIEPDLEAYQEYVNNLHDRGMSIVNLADVLQEQIRLKKLWNESVDKKT